jgi:hypothetical protein
MNDTDSRRAQHEIAELYRMVEALFSNPREAPPELEEARSRAQLRIWERPSFDVNRCWAVWGAGPSHKPMPLVALARRLTWRTDIDVAGRSDPLRRLQRLGEIVQPTIEVADAKVDVAELQQRLADFPQIESIAGLVGSPPHFMIDGTHYGLELDAGLALIRFEWTGDDWTHPDESFVAVARWAHAVCEFLDEQLDG